MHVRLMLELWSRLVHRRHVNRWGRRYKRCWLERSSRLEFLRLDSRKRICIRFEWVAFYSQRWGSGGHHNFFFLLRLAGSQKRVHFLVLDSFKHVLLKVFKSVRFYFSIEGLKVRLLLDPLDRSVAGLFISDIVFVVPEGNMASLLIEVSVVRALA